MNSVKNKKKYIGTFKKNVYDVRISDESISDQNGTIKHEYYLASKDQRFLVFIFFPKKNLILAFETNSATSLNCAFYLFFIPMW